MRLLLRLVGYMRPYIARLILGGLLLAVAGALMAAVAMTLKPLVNEVLLPEGFSGRVAETGLGLLERARQWFPDLPGWAREKAVVRVPLLLVAIFFVRGICLYFGQYLTMRTGAHVIRDLRTALHESVTHQSLAFFQAHPTGLILSRILNDVQRLQRVSTTVLADFVRVGAMVPFLLATAIYHDWRMSIAFVVALPLLGYPIVRLGRRLRRASTASQESMAEVANRVTEAVGGVKIVQSFGMERFEVSRFREAVDRMLRADLRAARAQSLSPAVMELLAAIVGSAMFALAGLGIARGFFDAGDFTVVLFCLGMLFASFRRLSSLYAEVQQALAAAVRVFDMLDREREICDRPAALPKLSFDRQIRFAGVCFSYGEERVLDGVDVTIDRGQMVALVGPSGSGKSTLANLLPRFYDPTAGSVLLDGQDIRDLTLASLRALIGVVTQEPILFDDTVRNNIAYGRAKLPQNRVLDAARAAHAHEFIEDLPRGYDTLLGERGMRLSMGQRQRITIARALLKAPPILILDEATSSLDAESEALVQQALDTLLRGRTSLVIAHRLTTIRRADRILVMERGRIVEDGTHDELLRLEGRYARLHRLQFRELEP